MEFINNEGTGTKILLIEDNPGDARLIKEFLKSEEEFSYELHWISALRDIDHAAPDIILLDLNLPESVGMETFDFVHSTFPDIPIIVTTGVNDSHLGNETVAKGAQDYLVKGMFSGPLLIKALQYAIERNNLVKKHHQDQLLHERDSVITEIFDNASVAIYRTTREGKFLVANQAMAKMLGYNSIEELKSINASQLYLSPEIRDIFVTYLENKRVINGYEGKLVRKDGTVLTTLESSKVVTDINGNVCFEGVIEDITKRKEAEQALNESLKEKEVLLRELHHRTKNNMQVIISLIALKAALLDDEPIKSVLNDITARIRTMALIHQKLYQSQNLAYVELNDYISDLAALLINSYNTTSGKVSLFLKLENIKVLVDTAIQCGLIINELITNSLKYAFPGNNSGVISISLSRSESNNIVLVISDNGIGMPGCPDIFKSETLGMQLLKMITEDQLSGSISFDTENGVTCRITLDGSLSLNEE